MVPGLGVLLYICGLIEGGGAGNAQADHGRAHKGDDTDVEAQLDPDGRNYGNQGIAERCGVGGDPFLSGKSLGKGDGNEGKHQSHRDQSAEHGVKAAQSLMVFRISAGFHTVVEQYPVHDADGGGQGGDEHDDAVDSAGQCRDQKSFDHGLKVHAGDTENSAEYHQHDANEDLHGVFYDLNALGVIAGAVH